MGTTKTKKVEKPILSQKEIAKIYKILTPRVKRGVQFLDKYFGRNKWVNHINIQKLNLVSPVTCILGQSFRGHFDEGITKLQEVNDGADEVDYGFNMSFDDMDIINEYSSEENERRYDKAEQMAWDILGNIWKDKISMYRAALSTAKVKAALKVVSKATSII